MRKFSVFVVAWTILVAASAAFAGTKQISLTTRDGKVVPIGTVIFAPKDGTTTFAVHSDTGRFQDSCLGWLSHSLLFFFKNPADYGAKLTNGLIYDLRLGEHGIEGLPQAVDLNAIASPPADLAVPPYDKEARSDIADGTRWISKLSIDLPPR